MTAMSEEMSNLGDHDPFIRLLYNYDVSVMFRFNHLHKLQQCYRYFMWRAVCMAATTHV